jgi:hypothetical protein
VLLAIHLYLGDLYRQIGVVIAHIGFAADDAFDLDPTLVVVVSYVAFVETLRRGAGVEAQSAEEQEEEAKADQPDSLILSPEEKARQE